MHDILGGVFEKAKCLEKLIENSVESEKGAENHDLLNRYLKLLKTLSTPKVWKKLIHCGKIIFFL